MIHEDASTQHLIIGKIDQFSDTYREIDAQGRGLNIQQQRLQDAHQLLSNGWGLNLGSLKEQQLELDGKLQLTKIIVRFDRAVMYFIKEGEKRHRSQKIVDGKKDSYGKPLYVDYHINLPERSIREFTFWVNRFKDSAEIIAPES